MKLRADALMRHLQQSLAPIYLISGNELLLVQEACDQIRACAKQQGYESQQRMHVTSNFAWSELLETASTLSLFSEKRLLELHMPDSKFGTQGSKILTQYCQQLPQETILIITCKKLDKAQQRARWFTALDKVGVIMQVWPLVGNQFIQWIKQRLQTLGLQTDHAGLQLIADATEGNLLAAHQEIIKLQLLHGQGKLSCDEIATAIADNARFEVFQFVDCVLAGDQTKILRMLDRIESEGLEPTLILWALTRELRSLHTIKQAQVDGQPLAQIFQQHRVWPQRQACVQSALQRLSLTMIYHLIQTAARLDRIIKGLELGNIWDEMSMFCLRLGD